MGTYARDGYDLTNTEWTPTHVTWATLNPMPESTSSPVRDLGFGLQRDPSRDLNLLSTRHYFLFIMFIPRLKASVMDRHRFDTDPDPDFQVGADPDPDGHQNAAEPHADPSPSFTHVRK